jgi:hypothetical protein
MCPHSPNEPQERRAESPQPEPKPEPGQNLEPGQQPGPEQNLEPEQKPEPGQGGGGRGKEHGLSAGYEHSDVRASGVVVFLTAMVIFVAVIGLFTYGLGKLLNAYLAKGDGPPNKWAQRTPDVRALGNMPSSPELQNKVAELTQSFPTPRLQTDDGSQDVADLHAREDLLLDYYSLVGPPAGPAQGAVQGAGQGLAQGKVRIPIERAMELLAQRGLPVAPVSQQAPLMTGEQQPTVAVPLTNGFARTGYEQDQEAARQAEGRPNP